MATRTQTARRPRKPRSAPKSSRQTSHRLAGLSDAEIIGQIAAYIRQTATDGQPIGIKRYEATRPPELPSMSTIRVTRGITWNQCIEAAGYTPREQQGGKQRTRPAAPAQRQPPAAYVATPHIVTAEEIAFSAPKASAHTVNVYSARSGRPGRPLDPAPVSYAGLPEPERDPITGRLPPVIDCLGRPVPRVTVYPGERTCLKCGETFVIHRQMVQIGRSEDECWEEREIGFCPRCGIAEEGNARKLPTPPPSVATLDYLQAGEYQTV